MEGGPLISNARRHEVYYVQFRMYIVTSLYVGGKTAAEFDKSNLSH